MQWIIPISIWGNNAALVVGSLLSTDILQLRLVIWLFVLIDIVATVYWSYYKKRRKANILNTIIYTEGGVLHIEGKRKDLEIILSSTKQIIQNTKGDTVKIKLRR